MVVGDSGAGGLKTWRLRAWRVPTRIVGHRRGSTCVRHATSPFHHVRLSACASLARRGRGRRRRCSHSSGVPRAPAVLTAKRPPPLLAWARRRVHPPVREARLPPPPPLAPHRLGPAPLLSHSSRSRAPTARPRPRPSTTARSPRPADIRRRPPRPSAPVTPPDFASPPATRRLPPGRSAPRAAACGRARRPLPPPHAVATAGTWRPCPPAAHPSVQARAATPHGPTRG